MHTIATYITARALRPALVAAWGSLLLCGVVLLGWFLDDPLMKGLLPGRVAMPPWGAVMFTLLSLSLLLHGWRSRDRGLPESVDLIARVLAGAAGLLASFFLVEYYLPI